MKQQDNCRAIAAHPLMLSLCCVMLGLPGGATHAQSPGSVKSITTTLTSSAARKECLNLSPQQRLQYWYRADGPVNFAVQLVQGKETLYPVKKDQSAIGSGGFQPKVADTYCLVWTNLGRQPVTLTMEFGRLAAN